MTPVSGGATTAAMLQGLVANKGDGWEWFLDQFAAFLQSVEHLASPPETSPPGLLKIQEPMKEVRDNAGTALNAAALLGRRTAELHLALSTQTQDQAFCAERFTSTELGQDVRRIEAQLTQTLETLKSAVLHVGRFHRRSCRSVLFKEAERCLRGCGNSQV